MMKSSPIHFVKGQNEKALCNLVLSARSETTNKPKKVTCKACIKVKMHHAGHKGYRPTTHREDREL
jgi:hypothetical protein